MERGVNSIVCKQRGRLFTSKRGFLCMKETPSSFAPPLFQLTRYCLVIPDRCPL
ncbi:hypothetical protein HMPREF0973_00034 [Prevotella veroralis F0319]|uniref:Uncharacterized protein n=1 Tax=Prevotella veroralis F0319 TaxID=649761 RepID=C9MKB5_9BACT|nr:hypothetical protein HMPREF0973_00034 [Prevotella veroralis F0319]